MPGETCTTGGSSISGLAFYTADAFPAAYKNALFFSDYSRNCIWVMYPGANGLPDPAHARRPSSPAPRARWSSPRARTARSTTPTSRAARSAGRRRQQRADGADHRHADVRRGPLTVAFNGTARATPRASR